MCGCYCVKEIWKLVPIILFIESQLEFRLRGIRDQSHACCVIVKTECVCNSACEGFQSVPGRLVCRAGTIQNECNVSRFRAFCNGNRFTYSDKIFHHMICSEWYSLSNIEHKTERLLWWSNLDNLEVGIAWFHVMVLYTALPHDMSSTSRECHLGHRFASTRSKLTSHPTSLKKKGR